MKLRSVALLLLSFVAHTTFSQSGAPSVLLVSFDGFRHDYIDKYDLKNFKAFRAEGASAEGLIPCYPSLTFPNHYSIVTGLIPAHHGLVDNSFYDSILNVTYTISNRDLVSKPDFYGGTPLWTLARKAGMKSASYFWVGSEIDDPLRAPDKYFVYDAKTSFITRVDTVLSWLNKKDSERPRLITLYFSEPDHVSHDTGPNSLETRQMLLTMDSVLGILMNGIREVKAPVNTILVSDHGMTELTVKDETYVFLDELYDVRSRKIRSVASSGLAHIYVDDVPRRDSLYSILKSKENHYKAYKRNELPKHIKMNHYRVGDIVMIADHPYYIRFADRKNTMQRMKAGSHFGVHGFDPTVVKDMQGIFLAQGPNVKKGVRLGTVRNIDIYPFVTRILGLKDPAIDGDPKALSKIYVK